MKKVKGSGQAHHGNLPLEILTYLSAYLESIIDNKTFATSCMQTTAINSLGTMADTLTGCERILLTPLPAAYNIAISQITWLYVLVLPFQLYTTLEWIAIPGTIVAAYIILGLAAIGREIENPFGRDVNDLNLDYFCNALAIEMDVLTSKPPPKTQDWIQQEENAVLWPLSTTGWQGWMDKQLGDIRAGLKQRVKSQRDTISEIRKEEAELDAPAEEVNGENKV
jgi:predicted membrane chloride channel (bestrophin family)